MHRLSSPREWRCESLCCPLLTSAHRLTPGALLPGYHTFYWMGLNVTGSWPRFNWIDGLAGPNRSTYQHWGYYMPQNILEPNNIFPPENCAGANFTQAYDIAWAWSDASCSVKAPYICKALALGAFYYTSAISGATYVFNNTPITQVAAAQACKDYGAAPVSFTSLEEQLEVGPPAAWVQPRCCYMRLHACRQGAACRSALLAS